MKHSITLNHRRFALHYLVIVEKDDIFIAVPQNGTCRNENIFLTRINGRWAGDCRDKPLVKKIGLAIDAALAQPAATGALQAALVGQPHTTLAEAGKNQVHSGIIPATQGVVSTRRKQHPKHRPLT